MKKIILLLSFLPFGLFAQSGNTPANNRLVKVNFPREGYVSPVQVHGQTSAPVSTGKTHQRPQASNYTPSVVQTIGTTVYDLQTNGALAKRLQLYSAGKMSYVWIKSDDNDSTNSNFTTRYSGYNSFDGSNWGGQNTSQFESDRSGWPNIGEVTNGSEGTYEFLTSHYAQAATNIYAGGIFWLKNSGIGKTDFTQIIDNSPNRDTTAGLLWPRMATSNNRVYMIGTYEDDRKISGVYNPIVYFCYNTSTHKFESKNITLPGYDSTRYGTGSADEYSIDARNQYVAIITGGYETDLALWKSSDSGKTFIKTIINNYAAAPFNPKNPPTMTDTVIADDGTASVALDNQGVAHVTYTPVRTIDPTADSGVSYAPRVSDSIVYWNDKDQKKINVGGVVDYYKTGVSTILMGSGQTDPNYAGYTHDFASYSNIAIDPSGNIFVVFSAPHEDDLDGNGNCYRHVYCSAYDAAHSTWHTQQDIVPTWNQENVYATVARDADSKLHLVFMQKYSGDNAGLFLPGAANPYNTETVNHMVYEEVSTTDLLTDKVGLFDELGVNENLKNNLFSTGSLFPNPAQDKLNISLNLTHSATVMVKLYSVLGNEMLSQNYEMLPTGANNLQLGLNGLPTGVYMCNISAGGYTTTQQVVVSK